MDPKCRFLCLLSAVVCLIAVPSWTQNIPDAQAWLTTVDRAALFARQAEPMHFSEARSDAPVIVVNDMEQFQPIEGLGFALTGGSAQLLMQMTPERRAALLKRLFTTEGDGIGVSYLRVSIGASDMNDHVYSYDDMAPGELDPNLTKFSLAPDEATVIPVLKEILAIDPLIKILGSPWSAPAWMKTNDMVKGGNLKPEFYGAYAEYLVKYIEGMKAEGIPITAITVENEPLNPKNTPSMVVFAQEEDTFIGKYLGPAFEKGRDHDGDSDIRSQSRRHFLSFIDPCRPSREQIRSRNGLSFVWRRQRRANSRAQRIPEQEPIPDGAVGRWPAE